RAGRRSAASVRADSGRPPLPIARLRGGARTGAVAARHDTPTPGANWTFSRPAAASGSPRRSRYQVPPGQPVQVFVLPVAERAYVYVAVVPTSVFSVKPLALSPETRISFLAASAAVPESCHEMLGSISESFPAASAPTYVWWSASYASM